MCEVGRQARVERRRKIQNWFGRSVQLGELLRCELDLQGFQIRREMLDSSSADHC